MAEAQAEWPSAPPALTDAALNKRVALHWWLLTMIKGDGDDDASHLKLFKLQSVM